MPRAKPKQPGLYPIGPNEWRVKVAAGVDVAKTQAAGKSVYRSVERRFRGTLAEAKAFRDQLAIEARQGAYGGTEATMDQLVEAWLLELERIGRAPNTLRGYREKWTSYSQAAFGAMRVRDVTPRQITEHLDDLGQRGLKPNTIRLAHAGLSSMFAQAVRWEWVGRNPAKLVRWGSLPNTTPLVPTPADVILLLTAARAAKPFPEMEGVIWLGAVTGLRNSEIRGLRISDFDADKGVLAITRAISDGKVWTTKNRRERNNALDAVTAAVVAAQVDRMTARATKNGTSLADGAYLYSDNPRCATYWPEDRITKPFAKIAAAAGVSYTFKHLRKFMDTYGQEIGFTAEQVALRAGHDPSMARQRYTGQVETTDRAISTGLASLLTPGQ